MKDATGMGAVAFGMMLAAVIVLAIGGTMAPQLVFGTDANVFKGQDSLFSTMQTGVRSFL